MSISEAASGERALMHAVIEDAILCLRGQAGTTQHRARLAADARTWIEERDAQWPFSFENLCEALDLDARRLRTRLLADAPEIPSDTNGEAPRPRRPKVDRAAVVEMIRAGNPLRVVAATFGISVPTVSTLSGAIASQIRAERDVEIRRLHNEGWTVRALASRFELSRVRVCRICGRPVTPSRERTAA